jgi:uncharacterized protein (DUF1778 family)
MENYIMRTIQQDAATSHRGRITARVPQHVIEKLELAASISGSTLNQFVTQASLEKAEKIMENERAFCISEETAAWLLDLLDNPPPPSAQLVKNYKEYLSRRKDKDGDANSVFEFGT